MAKQLQLRRGTHAEVAAFTGAVGEPLYDQTEGRITISDGVTLGGIPLARYDELVGGATGILVAALGGVAPVGAPAPGIVLEVDSDTNALYCWTGAAWLTLIAAP